MCYWCGCFLPDDGQYHAKRNDLEVKLTCELLLAICSLEKKRYRCLIVLAHRMPKTRRGHPLFIMTGLTGREVLCRIKLRMNGNCNCEISTALAAAHTCCLAPTKPECSLCKPARSVPVMFVGAAEQSRC
jgi:hypothetical protein